MDYPNIALHPRHWVKRNPVLSFVSLAYGISWPLWIPAGLLLPEPYATTAHFAGAFGPLIAAALVVAMGEGSAKAWLIGLFRWQVHLGWYAFALFFPVFLIAVMSVRCLIIGNRLDWVLLPERLTAYVPTFAFMAVAGGRLGAP